MNHGARTFILTGLVVVVLLALHQLPTIYLNDSEMRHVNILSDIIPEVYGNSETEDTIPLLKEVPDSVAQADTVSIPSRQVIPDGVTMIDDYSGGAPGGMRHFYEMLNCVKSLERPVRIAYFGDSFIEGDILTCDIRERLQRRFGGNGVGWVDCGNKINGFRPTISQKFSGFSGYEVVKKPYNHNNAGINQRYFIPSENAVVWTGGTKYRKHSSGWNVARLFLRTGSGLSLHTSINGRLETVRVIDSASVVRMIEDRDSMRNISYRFTGVGHDTFIYGMALESDYGVVLDNFSMRGSAGFTIANIPHSVLADFARLRPYDLIILHFGLNVVSEKSRSANYKAYIKRMTRAVEKLRGAYPEASILIVSVPDRNQRTADGIKTMPGIESLSAYQQIMASECKVAYFNLFKAMGGRESMKALVERKLANKDYTHLSFGGGTCLAGYFYDSFMAGYDNYKYSIGE